MSRESRIQYNPALTVKENAKKNGVSEAAIRYYIKVNCIDRRFERKQKVIDDCKEYLRTHKNATWDEVQKNTGHSLSTIRKYREYIVGRKVLTDFDIKKAKNRQCKQLESQERLFAYLDTVPKEVLLEYLAQREGGEQNNQRKEGVRNGKASNTSNTTKTVKKEQDSSPEVNQEELANMLTWMTEEEAMRLLKAREAFQRRLKKD